MVALTSSMLPLGNDLIPFTLNNHNPRYAQSEIAVNAENEVKGYLIAVISNHCPYVINLASALAKVGNAAQQAGLQVVAIGCNDIENYPADAPEKIPTFAEQYGFDFPYCFDEAQQIAKDYTAVCTPDFFLFDAGAKLVYRGQFDASRPGNGVQAMGSDMQAAIDSLLAGEPISAEQSPSLGCSIKWK